MVCERCGKPSDEVLCAKCIEEVGNQLTPEACKKCPPWKAGQDCKNCEHGMPRSWAELV